MRSLHLGAIVLTLAATACSSGVPVTSDDDANDASGAGAGTTGVGATTGSGGDLGVGGGATTSGTGGDPTTSSGTTSSTTTSGTGGMGGDPTTTSSSSTTSGSGGSTTVCGDGVVEGAEMCDDANLAPNDGCDPFCVTEPGFSCNGAPSICTTICGDGIIAGPEGCDDANSDPKDGCSSACLVEPSYLCDGTPSVCNLTPTAPGDLVITEIMKNPGPTISDTNGEWFEVHNPTATDFDLMGMEIADQGSDSHLIGAHLVVPAGGYAVIGRSTNASLNGGVTVDYVMSGVILGNGTDEIELHQANTLIDAVAYSDASFPDDEGVAMSLSPSADHLANDSGSNWCGASTPFGTASMMGSPGAANASCNIGPPPGWTCSAGFYDNNDGCDCGCGVTDPDCADASSSSCQWCDNTGSCSTVTGCGDINPVDNAICGAPPTWTCNASYYNAADGCDCGCGALDPDCADNSASSCQWCNNSGSCSTVTGCGDIDPTDNTTCTAPATWTCNPNYYNANDGCDCGCGVTDPDCADTMASSCQWCDNVGSCSNTLGCSDIHPTMNAGCL